MRYPIVTSIFLLILCLASRTLAETSSLYDLGDKLFPYSESNIFKNEKELETLLRKHNINTVIEVGSWFGKSTIFIAKHLPPNGKVYAIDSWIGYPRETYEITRHVYERFLSNVVHADLTDCIVPIRMTSLSANRIFNQYCSGKVDMIYIDGDHAYEAVYSDLTAWSKYLKKSGILCGNLYSKNESESETIKKAVNDYCCDKGLTVTFDNYFWLIHN